MLKSILNPVLSMTIEIKWTISDLQRNWSILGREICICICNTKVWCLCNSISTSPKCHKIYMYLCTCGCYNINIVIVDHCSTCQHVHYNTYCIKIHFGWPLLSPSCSKSNRCSVQTSTDFIQISVGDHTPLKKLCWP